MNRFFWALQRIPRVPRWLYWRFRENVAPIPSVIRLWWISHHSTAPITDPKGPVVSLTTYGARSRKVYLVIESIATGTLLPSRIILWLDDEKLFKNLPVSIRRLVQRGLEVKLCANYGPHTKYYPYVAAESAFDVALVTADDDHIYPENWLGGLVAAFQEMPNVVNCYRCYVISLAGNSIGSYRLWGKSDTTRPSFRHLALGVCGVLYPPAFLKVLKNAGTAFKNCCPTADDLWLHVQALRAGYKVRQIRSRAGFPLSIPGTEGIGLWKVNIYGGNDRQIATTYTADDVRKLLAVQHQEDARLGKGKGVPEADCRVERLRAK